MPPEGTTTLTSPGIILQGWIPLLTILGTLITAIITGLFGIYIANRNANRANDNAVQAREATNVVAQQLVATDAKTSKKLDTIHSLVNSRLTAALQKIDRLEERLFETEGRVPTGEEPPKPPDDPGPYPPGPAT